MYCKQVVRRLLRQCGRKVTAQLPEGEISLTAYLNPLRERDDRLGFGESGMVQQGRWLLLAPWEEGEALSAGTVVTAAGEDFLLERVEKVYFQGEPAYVWGLAVREQELVAQQLKGSDSALRVERAYPAKLRGNPQCEKLAVIGIQKVKLEPVGLQNFYGGQTLPLGRQATVWVKVSFCCKSGEDCWKLWESCAQGMLFSQQLKLSQIECGEAAWNKDWGGVVLPVLLCLSFVVSGSDEQQPGTRLEEIKVIRKGAAQ